MTYSSSSSPEVASSHARPPNWITAWGVLGSALAIGVGLYRVTPHAVEPLWPQYQLSPFHAWLYAVSIVFTAYAEGYKGFQRGFTPRVIARAKWVSDHPGRVPAILAPIFALGFYGIQRRKLIFTWVFTFAIVAVVVAMKFLAQPWRGILDAGVVVGLSWGVASMVIGLIRIFQGQEPKGDPFLPDAWNIDEAQNSMDAR